MRESELRRFLAARVGQTVCVSYRVDTKGMIQRRPEPRGRLAALATSSAMLAACAGHGIELESPGSPCIDPAGYEVVCDPQAVDDMLSVPPGSGAPSPSEQEGEGCPIQPNPSRPNPSRPNGPTPPPTDPEPAGADHDPLGLLPGGLAPGVGALDRPSASSSSTTEIRRHTSHGSTTAVMGAMVVTKHLVTTVPPTQATRDLWFEARERWAERRARRRRLRTRR
ncbi:MAG: hypothetical protein AAGF11_43275 [Myxococcota bacterium]